MTAQYRVGWRFYKEKKPGSFRLKHCSLLTRQMTRANSILRSLNRMINDTIDVDPMIQVGPCYGD